MTETTIDHATCEAEVVGGVDIRIEDDASPIVRLIGRTIADSLRADRASSAALPRRLGRPSLARAQLDVAADQPPQNLRWARVLLGAEPLEQLFLARVDEDRESGCASFQGQRSLPEHVPDLRQMIMSLSYKYNAMHCSP